MKIKIFKKSNVTGITHFLLFSDTHDKFEEFEKESSEMNLLK